jgi:hypothetical protein
MVFAQKENGIHFQMKPSEHYKFLKNLTPLDFFDGSDPLKPFVSSKYGNAIWNVEKNNYNPLAVTWANAEYNSWLNQQQCTVHHKKKDAKNLHIYWEADCFYRSMHFFGDCLIVSAPRTYRKWNCFWHIPTGEEDDLTEEDDDLIEELLLEEDDDLFPGREIYSKLSYEEINIVEEDVKAVEDVAMSVVLSNGQIYSQDVAKKISEFKVSGYKLVISHLCGNGACVRPIHLFLEEARARDRRKLCHKKLRETKGDTCPSCQHYPPCFVNLYTVPTKYYY